MRAIAYCRVSTNGQAEHGLGLEIQEQAAREWADRSGAELGGPFVDAGASGALPAEERPGLAAALDALGPGDVLVAYNLSRLGRELHVQEAVLAQAWAVEGVRVYEAERGEEVLRDDPEDPMRTAMRQMAGVFHQLDKALIRKRLRDGRRRKAETKGPARGPRGYVGGEQWRPFGWRLTEVAAQGGEIRRDWAPVPEEQEVIRFLVERYRGGASLRDCAAWLERRGSRSPRGGRRWSPSYVALVLRREGVEIRPVGRRKKGGAP